MGTFFTFSLGEFIKKNGFDVKKNIESNTNFNNSKDIFVIEDIFKKTKATFRRFMDKLLTKATFMNL